MLHIAFWWTFILCISCLLGIGFIILFKNPFLLLGQIGAAMNAIVILSNEGIMPVVGANVGHWRATDSQQIFLSHGWASVDQTPGNLLWLADHTSIGRASPGDLVILSCTILCILTQFFWHLNDRARRNTYLGRAESRYNLVDTQR